ncbi:MAG: WecB/TagA/CpsF family glycosyltransferase [Spirochaetales bacterium]|nr:WecB/TagA/CpsF family glycosyltransferase [Spirochaetales bacterium]
MAVERIHLLKVPLDIVHEEDMEEMVLALLSRDGPQHIIMLSLWDFMRARHRGEFQSLVSKAALVIPTSRALVRGARFLKKTAPVRYQSFSFIINVLGILERYYKTLYLLGGNNRSLMQAEKNVRSTFPHLGIVGRFAGHYHRSMERKIQTAIVKAHPSLVIMGNGIPGGQRWIYRNKSKLHSGIFFWDADVIDIFSERKRRVSDKTFERGHEYLGQIVKNPFRILRFFQYLWYNLVLLYYRLFRVYS